MPPTPVAPAVVTATRADQVCDILAEQISSGELPPGADLRELDLAARYGVSRTPVREALLRLSGYGLVTLSGRSARVRQITRAEVRHVFQVRMALELTAVRLACGKLTADDFARLEAVTPADPDAADAAASGRLDSALHTLIAERSGNPVLAREVGKCRDLIRLAQQQLGRNPRWVANEVREHAAVVAALRAGDRAASVQALRAHLRAAYRNNAACAPPAAPPNP
jgi:DNA-binding GntR family transcriptional regulator